MFRHWLHNIGILGLRSLCKACLPFYAFAVKKSNCETWLALIPCPDYWIGFYFPSYGAKWKKKHALSLLLKCLEGDFRYLSYRSKLIPWGLCLGDEGVGGNYVVVFQASLIMCFKYCVNVVSVILNINLMYWQGGYNDITMHLV